MGLGVDRTIFDRLVRTSLPAAHRFAIRLCGPARLEAAEELVTEALYRAARSWKTYRGQDDEQVFRGWLWRIVINAFRDELAKRPAAQSLEEEDEGEDRDPDPAAVAEGHEMGELVAKLVSDLPPRQREVIVLTAYEGHTTSQAAAILGVSEQNVRATLHQAREKLRQKLARRLPDLFKPETEKRRE